MRELVSFDLWQTLYDGKIRPNYLDFKEVNTNFFLLQKWSLKNQFIGFHQLHRQDANTNFTQYCVIQEFNPEILLAPCFSQRRFYKVIFIFYEGRRLGLFIADKKMHASPFQYLKF